MLSGSPAEVRAELRRVIRDLYPCDKGCIIVPNMIPMGTPKENIHAWTSALKEYGPYPLDIDRINHDIAAEDG